MEANDPALDPVHETEFVSVDIVSLGESPIQGTILDASGRAMAVISNDPIAPTLGVGERVSLRFALDDEAFDVAGVVRSVASVLDVDRYAVDFVEPDALHATDKSLVHALFDRRLTRRVVLAGDVDLRAEICDEETDESWSASIQDVSPSGLFVRLGDTGGTGPRANSQVLVNFRLPDRTTPLRLISTVRRIDDEGGLALQFVTEEVSPSAFTRGAILDFVARQVAAVRRSL